MDNETLLQQINTHLGYRFHADEMGFHMLTQTRYTKIKRIPAAFFASFDGKKFFKVTCEEIPFTQLPEKEQENLAQCLESENQE